jgi:hypothetical protein
MTTNLTKSTSTAHKTTDAKKLPPNLQWLRDRDRETVRGMFQFHEVPGGCLAFVYKAYKGDKVEKFELFDGQIYSLPRGVAIHINKNIAYPEYEHFKNEGASMGGFMQNAPISMRVSKKTKRCSFQSLEFMDIEGMDEPSKILTVELGV